MRKALIFDCDGVLADTEQFGHLTAFNQMWREFNVPWQWSMDEYGRKLKIGGGKERMTSLFQEASFLSVYQPPDSEDKRQELIVKWHQRKTEIYRAIIHSGLIPSRSGVRRLAREAMQCGWLLAIASTSSPESVEAVVHSVMGTELAARISLILAGDSVKAKKPVPDIYIQAAAKLGVDPNHCIVIEDSRNGLLAAIGAGMKCLITMSAFTQKEDFSEAVLVLTCLGDPGGEKCEVIVNRSSTSPDDSLTVDDLDRIIAGTLSKRPVAQNARYNP